MALTLKRKSSETPEVVLVSSPAELQVPPSSFDFTEGAFGRAERTRRTLMGVVLAGAVGIVLVGGAGIQATFSAADDQSLTAAQEQQYQTDSDRLAQVDQAGGFSSAQLSEHLASREDAKKAADASQADNVRILNAVYDAGTQSGVVVSSVTITWMVGAPAAPGATAAAGAPAASASPTPTPSATGAAPAAGSGGGAAKTVTVQATAASFAQIAAFAENLKAIPGLSSAAPTWTGGGSAWSVSVNATMTDDAKGAAR